MAEHSDPGLSRLLREHRPASFGPGFSDRVMRRVAEEQESGLVLVAPAQFLRVAATGALIAAALATFSLLQRSEERTQSTLEALLGLDPITVSTVYDTASIGVIGRSDS